MGLRSAQDDISNKSPSEVSGKVADIGSIRTDINFGSTQSIFGGEEVLTSSNTSRRFRVSHCKCTIQIS